MNDHHQFLARQVAFGRATFGPGERRLGVLDHIQKEIEEVKKAEDHEARALEWVDLVILSQDGLLRCVREMIREAMKEVADQPMIFQGTEIVGRFGEPTADYVAKVALTMIVGKRDKNELRDWGDYRTKSEDEAIQHTAGVHD